MLGSSQPSSRPAASAPHDTSISFEAQHDEGERRLVHRLGGLFASEPELILAFLESAPSVSPPQAAAILAAAHEAVALKPEYADLHFYAARAAVRAGAQHDAAVLLERALELNPDYVDALILAAQVLRRLEQPTQAMEHLRRALSLGADYADVHMMIGELWRARGEPLLARQAYERALQLNPTFHGAREALGALPMFTTRRGRGDELPA